MKKGTEDSVTDRLAEYLRQNGIDAETQIQVYVGKTQRKADLLIRNDGEFPGEAKWHGDELLGVLKAREYERSPYASGAFLITYDKRLADVVGQGTLTVVNCEELFSGYKFHCYFMRKDKQTSFQRLTIQQIPDWLKKNIALETPVIDTREVINILRQGVDLLRPEVEKIKNGTEIFKNVFGLTIDNKKIAQAARDASAYLLLNQIIFYRFLAEQKGYKKIIPENINSPKDFIDYFSRVKNYTPIFGLNIVSQFMDKPDTLDVLRTIVKTVDALRMENIESGVIGKIYHGLIPLYIRKLIGAYYTLDKAARMLAYLSIKSDKDKIADLSCGCGTLLGASYDRKKELYQDHGVFNEETHKRFLEEDITGIDNMVFAAHLSVITLTFKAIEYETDKLNIAIWDSTTLKPGMDVKPLHDAVVESRRQRRLTDFEKPIPEEEKTSVGAITADGKPGEPIHLRKVDDVIGNPPFTRQEQITKLKDNYKADLRKNFSSRKHLLHGRMSYFSYFLFLADKFLDVGGRIAAVLPATVLMKESDFGVHKMLMDEYGIEYIIVRSDAPNFSEDTKFQEILLIAQKGKHTDHINYVILKNMDVSPSDVEKSVNKLEIGMTHDFGDYIIRRIPIKELDRDNLFKPVSILQDFDLLNLLESIRENKYMTIVDKSSISITRGIEGGKRAVIFPKFSINEKITGYLKKKDVWIYKKKIKDAITVYHRIMKNEFEIPTDLILPNLRRISGRDKINVSKLEEYILTDPFDEIGSFLNMIEESEIPLDWKRYLLKRRSHLCFVSRFDMGSPNTHHLGYYSDVERVFPGTTWVFKDLTKDEAKIVSLWANSSFHILQVLVNRIPTRGTWMEFTGYLLDELKILDPKNLNKKEKEDLLKVFNDISKQEFPSIVEQLAMNINIKYIDEKEINALEKTYSVIRGKIGIGFSPMREIDTAILGVLGFEREKINNILDRLYISLLREIKILTDMMNASNR